MTFHEHITSNSLVATFNPPVQYTANGAVKNPNKYINRFTRGYNDKDNKWEQTHPKHPKHPKHPNHPKPKGSKQEDDKRSHVRDWNVPRNGNTVRKIRGKNNQPDRLVISSLANHSARELCDHPNSLGPDFVSREEKLFCDMETGTLWPLCGETRRASCFDLHSRQMRHIQVHDEDLKSTGDDSNVHVKQYKECDEW
jgi:hypothetical protein